MKFARTSGALGLAALAAFAGPCAAADEAGWYGGLSIGRSHAKIDDARITSGLLGQGFTTTSIVDDNRASGYKVLGGYQINRNFAVEGSFFDLGNFGFNANTLPLGSLSGNIRLKGLALDAVGTLPVSERFSVIGRVGLNFAQAKDHFVGSGAVNVANPDPKKSDTNLKVGIGVQYAVTEALALRAEVERYRINDAVGNKGDIDLWSVGLIYRFGEKSQAPIRSAEPAPYVAPAPVVVAAAPPPPPARVAAPVPAPAPRFEKITLSATELFGFDSAVLRTPHPKLDEIAVALASSPSVDTVVITGYTDHLGSAKYNQDLSMRRALAVKGYLTGRGIAGSRFEAVGKGEANPVVKCTDKGRAALIKCLEPNRRVEVEQVTIERRVQ